MQFSIKFIVKSTFLLIFFIVFNASAQVIFSVNSFSDNNSLTGEGFGNEGDLRFCIIQSQKHETSKIRFLTQGQITLADSLPIITKYLDINTESNNIAIDGSSLFRIFTIGTTGKLVLNGLNLNNAYAKYASDGGGAILNKGLLTVTNCYFYNNKSDGDAGSIANRGNAAIYDSYFYLNATNGFGGAILNQTGNLTISKCKFEQNSSSLADGTISNSGHTSIFSSEFINNSAKGGSAAFSSRFGSSKSLIQNSVFYNNGDDVLPDIPAILNETNLTLVNNSIYSSVGSGVSSDDFIANLDTLTLINNIIAIEGALNNSLVGNTTPRSFNNIIIGAGLNDLQNEINGNFTEIDSPDSVFYNTSSSYYDYGLALAPYSKAIDNGLVSITGFEIPILDFKDSLRNKVPDIGAIEFQKILQSIDFELINEIKYTYGLVKLNAKSSSGLPLKYTADGTATIIGNEISLTGLGTINVCANQSGNKYYYPTTKCAESLVVKGQQFLQDFSILNDTPLLIDQSAIILPDLTSGNIAVNYQIQDNLLNNIASITGNFLYLFSNGKVSIEAYNAGNEYFDPFYEIVSIDIIESKDSTISSNLSNDDGIVNLAIYPNPSNGKLHFKTNKPAKIWLFNSLGQKLKAFEIKDELQINVETKGFYLLKIFSENQIFYKKIVIE